jgi:hypothetical protein
MCSYFKAHFLKVWHCLSAAVTFNMRSYYRAIVKDLFTVDLQSLYCSRRMAVKQCILDYILCHNIVLEGNSVVEFSAVCYGGYENGRHENVSSGVNILINQRTTQPHLKSFIQVRVIWPTENLTWFCRPITQRFFTVCKKSHDRPSSIS